MGSTGETLARFVSPNCLDTQCGAHGLASLRKPPMRTNGFMAASCIV